MDARFLVGKTTGGDETGTDKMGYVFPEYTCSHWEQCTLRFIQCVDTTPCVHTTKATSKSTNLKRRNIGIANMHKKYRRQDRDPGWLDHILAR